MYNAPPQGETPHTPRLDREEPPVMVTVDDIPTDGDADTGNDLLVNPE